MTQLTQNCRHKGTKLRMPRIYLIPLNKIFFFHQAVTPVEKIKRVRRAKDIKPKQMDGLLQSARTHYPYPTSVTYNGKDDEFIQRVDTFMRKQLSGRKILFAEWESFHRGVTDIHL
ncbi:hypothetical protein HJ015_20795 [Vibrio parahaemolyticus]|nr:hypothetical protein [Vibrio parahaemolyticus]